MPKKVTTLLIILSFHLISVSVNIKNPIKFGKVEAEDFKAYSANYEASVPAVMISNVGNIYLEGTTSGSAVNQGLEFVFKINRTCRIQILNQLGVQEYGQLILELYGEKDFKIELTAIKATTYNLENSSITKEKLDVKDNQVKDLNDYKRIVTINFPKVKVGSIIEFSYTLSSKNLSRLFDWPIQYEIPCIYNEISYVHPKQFSYKLDIIPNYPPAFKQSLSESLTTTETILVNGSYESQIVNIPLSGEKMAFTNVPAFKIEPFSRNSLHHVIRLHFFLQDFGNLSHQHYPTSWFEFIGNMQKSGYFGVQYAYVNEEIKATANQITSSKTDTLEKINAVINYMKENYLLKDNYAVYLDNPISKTFNDKQGSISELNILAMVLLLESGIPTTPLFVADRFGFPITPYQLNYRYIDYCLAYTTVNNTPFIVDVSVPTIKNGRIRKDALHDVGILCQLPVTWVDLTNPEPEILGVTVDFSLSNNTLSGTSKVQANGYFADELYAATMVDDATFQKVVSDKFDNISISEITVNQKDKSEVNFTFTTKVENKVLENDNHLYVTAVPMGENEFNSFNQTDVRKTAIDFLTPHTQTYVFSFEIPEGYRIESLPTALKMSSESKDLNYLFISQQAGNKVSVTSRLIIKRPLFQATEYEHLKQFFKAIYDKQNEYIVLVKN